MALVCLDDFEQEAKEVLQKSNYDFYRSGASESTTVQWNRSAYKRSVSSFRLSTRNDMVNFH